jgi:hypothetical protein
MMWEPASYQYTLGTAAAHLVPRGELLVKGVVPVGDLYVDVQLDQAAQDESGKTVYTNVDVQLGQCTAASGCARG